MYMLFDFNSNFIFKAYQFVRITLSVFVSPYKLKNFNNYMYLLIFKESLINVYEYEVGNFLDF